MNWSEKDIDQIDHYLRGELTSDERKAFENRLSEDSAFARQVKEMKLLQQSARLSKMEKVFQGLQQTEASLKETPKRQVVIRKLWSRIAAAASIILVLGLGWYLLSPGIPDTQQVFAEAFEAYPNNVIKRSGANNYTELKRNAYSLYDQKKYAAAIPLFSTLNQTQPDTISLFYLAVASLANEQADEAILYFNEFLPFAEARGMTAASKWYLALAYLKKGNAGKARELLEELAEDSSSYGERAKGVLKKF